MNRVKVYNCIGMKLDYNTVGQVEITMLDYINGLLDDFDKVDPTDGGTKSSAASIVIFKLNKD